MTTSKRSGRGAIVALGVAAVVVVVAVVAVLATRSDENSSAGPQTYPVQVAGTPLTELPDPPAADPAAGKIAPTLTGQSLFDGSPVTIAPNGKARLVVFLAHWCPHCRAEVPRLVEWMASAQKPADLEVVAVSTAYGQSDINTPASSWLKEEGWPTPVLADSDDSVASAAYGLNAFPFLVVTGPDGAVKARISRELSVEQLTAFVTGALGT
jgi:cytochrome c biogenesis protein CcmG/thiol:disulfide interchange protein DsbE